MDKGKGKGILPVGVGETIRRVMGKSLLKFTGMQAQMACGSDQLCAGLPMGIEGAIREACKCVEDMVQGKEKMRVSYWWTPEILSMKQRQNSFILETTSKLVARFVENTS